MLQSLTFVRVHYVAIGEFIYVRVTRLENVLPEYLEFNPDLFKGLTSVWTYLET